MVFGWHVHEDGEWHYCEPGSQPCHETPEPQPIEQHHTHTHHHLGPEVTCDIDDAISAVDLSQPPQDWNKDAVAQWVAGYLYGISGQTIDKRNYIVACTGYDELLTKLLYSAMKDQCSGDTA